VDSRKKKLAMAYHIYQEDSIVTELGKCLSCDRLDHMMYNSRPIVCIGKKSSGDPLQHKAF
jgi:hypothetical protein